MMLCQFSGPGLKKWQLPLSFPWKIHVGESQYPIRSLIIQRLPWCEEAQTSHMEKETDTQLIRSNQARHHICHLGNSSPGRCDTGKHWGSHRNNLVSQQKHGTPRAIPAVSSHSNWSPAPLWSWDKSLLMCTAQIPDPQNHECNKMLF